MNDLTPTSHALNLKFLEVCKGRATIVLFLCVSFFMEIQKENSRNYLDTAIVGIFYPDDQGNIIMKL